MSGFVSFADLSILVRKNLRNELAIERPARSLKVLESKKPPDSDKTGNEGIQQFRLKTVQAAGLILLFDGEVLRMPEPTSTDKPVS